MPEASERGHANSLTHGLELARGQCPQVELMAEWGLAKSMRPRKRVETVPRPELWPGVGNHIGPIGPQCPVRSGPGKPPHTLGDAPP